MSNTRYEFTESERDLFKPRLLYMTESTYESDWHSTPHFHPFMEILFVRAGEGDFVIDTHRCSLTRGDIVIINPNHLHTELSTTANPMEYFILGIENIEFDVVKDELEKEDENQPFFPVFHFAHAYDRINYYVQEISKELKKKEANYQVVAQSLLTVFTVFLMRNTNLRTTLSENTKMSKECAFVKQYIDSHFSQHINLDELAKKTYISKYHLIHAYKKFTGMSPINYLIEKRITEAKALLRTTSLSVTDISQSVGFSSPAHFAQRFKTSVGKTPAEFRGGGVTGTEK